MRCNKCGRENRDDVRFCIYCGNKFEEEKEKKDLLKRARSKDQQALAEIYSQSCSAVYRVIRVLVKDEDTVNDLVQDTYVKAFSRLDQLQDEAKLVPWLKMIANNTAKDWLKKCKPVYFNELAGESDDTDDLSFEENIEDENIDLNPEMAMDRQEVSRLVMEILDQLPEDQRMVIGMFYYEEMSVKDIAEVLGVSDNTVKSRLNYGRKKIKELVLDLEKKGTRLYNVAPFAFFIYLLRCMEKSPAEVPEMGMLDRILGKESGKGIPKSGGKRENGTAKAGKTSGNSATESGKRVEHGSAEPGKAARRAPSEAGRAAESSAAKAGKTAGKAASTAGKVGKAAGTVAGTAAKRAGMKVAAWILAGTIGAGGVAYGVVKNADKIPFLPKQEETASVNSEEAAALQSEEAVEGENVTDVTEVPGITETPEATEMLEATATPEPTEEPELTATPEPTPTEEPTEEPEPTEAAEAENAIVPIAQGTYGDNIQWYIDQENTLIVVGTGAIADVDNMDDTQEKPSWWNYSDQIHRIVIGEGITYIGAGTFRTGDLIEDITMADTVTEIGEGAFSGLPNHVRADESGFTVTLSQSLEKIDDYAFAFSDVSSITLPDSVKEIGIRAFRRCYELETLTIGENSQLETIGSEAFAECPLSSVQLPENLHCIKSEAFWYGNFPSEMTFSDQLQELGLRAFGTTSTGLNTVYFTGNAPVITDDRIAKGDDAVFPDGTATVYYPQGNSTWDGYDFSQLAKYAQFIAYDPAQKPENTAAVQASGDTIMYYSTLLRAPSENSEMPGTTAVEVDGNSITFHASFYKNATIPFAYQDAEFVPFGEVTFEIADDMESCYWEADEAYWSTKEDGIRSCKMLSGLVCTLKVVNGIITEMSFNS